MNTSTLDLITRLHLIIIPIEIVLWDVFTILHGGRSISGYISGEARHTTSIPFAWGILTGHFFAWVMDTEGEFSIKVFWWVGALLAVILWDWYSHGHTIPDWMQMVRYPLIWVGLGTILGFLAWAQKGRFVS